jgi:pimeloyl-ACP methyl ester carboxylesterase
VSGTRGFYLDCGEPVFALFDPPADGTKARLGVLICPPWGWDELASYRSRRRWAELLASEGHPVLRIDLPATGDSGGDIAAPDLVEQWIEAIVKAGEWLRGEGGAAGLALLGLGVGGLLAEEALSRGLTAEELIVWGAPASGRHFAREMRAFAALQGGRPADVPGRPPALPDGWLEAGGFVFSDDTLAQLKKLSPAGVPVSRQALLIGRDGVDDTAGAERLTAAGVEVTEDRGAGWGAFVAHPETTTLPTGVQKVVSGWLGRSPGERGKLPSSSPKIVATPRATIGAHSEEAVWLPEGFGNAFGILTRPARPTTDGVCAVFLNAGAIRHVGPNGLWTEAARDLGDAGTPSLRIDLESIGEADGDEARRAKVADFYDPDFVAQVVGALDWLEGNAVGTRFRLVGLCAGAYWAFRSGLVDERIESMILLNAGALVWHPRILEERDGRRFGRVFKRHWWGMLWRREIKASSVLRLFRLVPSTLGRLIRDRIVSGAAPGTSTIAEDLSALSPGKHVVMGFSGSEPLREELEALGVIEQLDRWPDVQIVELPGADHTLRSAVAQSAALELIERELKRAAV